jgi:hypothetical protein
MPPITVPVNELVEISAFSQPLTRSDAQAVIAGDRVLAVCGIVSYQDSFNDTLKTVWQGLTLPTPTKETPDFRMVNVWYSP